MQLKKQFLTIIPTYGVSMFSGRLKEKPYKTYKNYMSKKSCDIRNFPEIQTGL